MTSRTEPAAALKELLAPFKRDDGLEGLVSLVGDLDSMRVLAAWPNTPKDWVAPDAHPPADLNDLWFWLWEGCRFDDQQFADGVELPVRVLAKKIDRLSMARVIYPDGTVHDQAAAFVRSRIKQEMGR